MFEDFLDKRGVTIENEDKGDDPDAAIIYGLDYAELEDNVRDILMEMFEERDNMPCDIAYETYEYAPNGK